MSETTPPSSGFRWRAIWPWLVLLVLAIGVAWGGHETVIAGITGWINDDGLYVDTAQALLHGKGFVTTVIVHSQPAYRYPIMFPALLALVSVGTHTFEQAVLRMQWVGPVCDGLWAVTIFVYMRRFAGWPAWGALAAAALAAYHPIILTVVSLILSDIPTALAGMLGVLAFEAAWRRERAWLFAPCGLLLVAVCLMRYEEATLVLAMGLALLLARRWRAALAFAGGFLVGIVPWVLYRAHAGGEEYGTMLGFLSAKSPAFLFKNLSAIAATLLSQTLPSLVVPTWPGAHTWVALVGGALVSVVILLGVVAALLRPREGASRFAPLYVLIAVGLVLVWMVRYVTTASFATSRLLLPLAPFVLLMFVRGLQEIRTRYAELERLPLRPLTAFVALVLTALTVNRFTSYVTNPMERAEWHIKAKAYRETFAFVRDKIPPKAVLLSLTAPAVYLHTGHRCHTMDYTITDAQLLGLLARGHVDYFVGMPFYLEPPPWLHSRYGLIDGAVVIINDLVKHHPGLLKPVYFNLHGRIGVFRIDKAVLAADLKRAKP